MRAIVLRVLFTKPAGGLVNGQILLKTNMRVYRLQRVYSTGSIVDDLELAESAFWLARNSMQEEHAHECSLRLQRCTYLIGVGPICSLGLEC